MNNAPTAAEIHERKARLLRESEACRAGLVQSKVALEQRLGGGSLLHGALRGIAGMYRSPLAAPGVSAMRTIAPAAISWVMGKRLRRPALIALSVASLALVWARSSRKRAGQETETHFHQEDHHE